MKNCELGVDVSLGPCEEVLAMAEKHRGDPHAACQEIVKAAYNYWATEDTRSDDVTCMVGR